MQDEILHLSTATQAPVAQSTVATGNVQHPTACVLQLFFGDNTRFGRLSQQQLTLDVLDGFRQRVTELLEILLVEKDLVFLVFLFANPLALRNRDIEILFRFRRFYIEEIRALSRPHPLRENLVFIVIFQRVSSREMIWRFVNYSSTTPMQLSSYRYLRTTATFPAAT